MYVRKESHLEIVDKHINWKPTFDKWSECSSNKEDTINQKSQHWTMASQSHTSFASFWYQETYKALL